MYIPKHYLIAIALIGAIALGFVSRLVTEQIGIARSDERGQPTASQQAGAPRPVMDPAVSGGAHVGLQPASPGAPIVSQPGGAGSTTNIYLTIVNTPAGSTSLPPSVNVVPGP